MKMTARVLFACFVVGYSVCSMSVFAYFEPSPVQPTTSQSTIKVGAEKPGADEQKMIPWKDYQEALKNEREELQKQAKENLDRMDKLQDRIFTAIVLLGGLILGFIYFLFGQTRKEVETQLTEEIAKNVRSQIEEKILSIVNAMIEPQIREQLDVQARSLEAMNLKLSAAQAEYNKLDSELKEMQSYKKRQILWFFSGEINTAEREINALQNAEFENIQPQKIGIGAPFELGNPDLIIFSYEKGDEGERRMKVIAGLMKKNIPNVWLLIHTKSNSDIGDAERKILGDLWYVPVNFPATVVVNAQALIRR